MFIPPWEIDFLFTLRHNAVTDGKVVEDMKIGDYIGDYMRKGLKRIWSFAFNYIRHIRFNPFAHKLLP